ARNACHAWRGYDADRWQCEAARVKELKRGMVGALWSQGIAIENQPGAVAASGNVQVAGAKRDLAVALTIRVRLRGAADEFGDSRPPVERCSSKCLCTPAR